MTAPKKGTRFLHRHQITGSPHAGTARPVEMVVTAVRQGVVYYRSVAQKSTRGAWRIDIEKFPTIVKEDD